MKVLIRSAHLFVAAAALAGSQQLWACRVAPDVAAEFAAKYDDQPNKENKRFFESVVLVRVTDAAPVTKRPSGSKFWAGTAMIERTLSGVTMAGKIGLAQVMSDSCHESFDAPAQGDRWVIYYSRTAGAPQSTLWPQAYPLHYALRFDPRVSEAIQRQR